MRIYFLLLPVACIVVLDEWLKARALGVLPDETALVEPSFVDFAIHRNFGLAFDLPFRMEFVLGVSAVIGFFLLRAAVKTWKTRPAIAFSCLMIVLGALGNFYDRLAYGFTVDYIIVLGRSAINFSDAVIVLGVISLLLLSSRQRRLDKTASTV